MTRLFRRKKEDPLNQHIKHSYNLFRNRITREIKKSKRKHYKEFFEGNLNNMKKTWQGIKQIININNKADVQINQLCHNGKQISSNEEMANTFNDFFTEIGLQLDKEIQSKRPGGCKIYLNSRIPNSFLISTTKPQEISDIINLGTILLCRANKIYFIFHFIITNTDQLSIHKTFHLPTWLLGPIVPRDSFK